MKMLSRTFRLGARLSSWWMIEMPRSRASVVDEKRDRLAVENDLARCRRNDAGQNLHQRRLAGAVLAEQRVTWPRWMSKLTPFSAWMLP